MPSPGEHRIIIGQEHDAFQARSHGWHLRDTITILLPGPRTAFAFLLRWPLQGTVIENVLKYSTGALNIDGCRVAHITVAGGSLDKNPHLRASIKMGKNISPSSYGMQKKGDLSAQVNAKGRWPPNLVLVYAPDCVQMGSKTVKGITGGNSPVRRSGVHSKAGGHQTIGRAQPTPRRFHTEDGTETVQNWLCSPHCPVRLLDLQSGSTNSKSGGMSTKALGVMNDDAWVAKDVPRTGHDDAGGASRFYPQFPDLTAAVRWLACLIADLAPLDRD